MWWSDDKWTIFRPNSLVKAIILAQDIDNNSKRCSLDRSLSILAFCKLWLWWLHQESTTSYPFQCSFYFYMLKKKDFDEIKFWLYSTLPWLRLYPPFHITTFKYTCKRAFKILVKNFERCEESTRWLPLGMYTFGGL